MKALYVEANFPIAIAMQQDDFALCERLLAAAESHLLPMVTPATALFEPLYTYRGWQAKLDAGIEEWKKMANQAARSHASAEKDLEVALRSVAVEAAEIADDRRTRFAAVLDRLATAAEIIPLSRAIIAKGHAAEAMGLKPQDALIFSAIITHANSQNAQQEELAFLTLDGDFKDAPVDAALKTTGLKVFKRPDDLIGWLGHIGINV